MRWKCHDVAVAQTASDLAPAAAALIPALPVVEEVPLRTDVEADFPRIAADVGDRADTVFMRFADRLGVTCQDGQRA